jgi:hypothetical protein
MSKVAHHHPRTYEVMGKTQEWLGKIMVAAALIGGAVILFDAFTNHSLASW